MKNKRNNSCRNISSSNKNKNNKFIQYTPNNTNNKGRYDFDNNPSFDQYPPSQYNKYYKNNKYNSNITDENILSPTSKIQKCLKDFENNFISKLSEQSKKEQRNLNMKNNHLNLLEKRLNKKANELENKAGKIDLFQKQLEYKDKEIQNKLEYKNEEIEYLKNTFNEEKQNLLNIIRQKNEIINELQNKLKCFKEKNKSYIELLSENERLKKVIFEQKDIIYELKNKIGDTQCKNNKIFMDNEVFDNEEDAIERIIDMDELKQIKKNIHKAINYNKNNCDDRYKGKRNLSAMNLNSGGNTKDKNRLEDNKKSVYELIKEKENLIKNCNYSSDDPLILKIDEKINRKKEEYIKKKIK